MILTLEDKRLVADSEVRYNTLYGVYRKNQFKFIVKLTQECPTYGYCFSDMSGAHEFMAGSLNGAELHEVMVMRKDELVAYNQERFGEAVKNAFQTGVYQGMKGRLNEI